MDPIQTNGNGPAEEIESEEGHDQRADGLAQQAVDGVDLAAELLLDAGELRLQGAALGVVLRDLLTQLELLLCGEVHLQLFKVEQDTKKKDDEEARESWRKWLAGQGPKPEGEPPADDAQADDDPAGNDAPEVQS